MFSLRNSLVLFFTTLLSLSMMIGCGGGGGSSSSDGSSLWPMQIGTDMGEGVSGIAVDLSGNVYIVGFTGADLDGSGPETHKGQDDVFIQKYLSNGTLLWTKQVGTTSWDQSGGIAVDSSGNVYVTGSTSGDLEATNAGTGSDIFIQKYSTDGVYQWGFQNGSTKGEELRGMVVDSSGNLYVIGDTYGDLEGSNAGTTGADFFIQKYQSTGTLEWTRQVGTSGQDRAKGIALNPTNQNVLVTGYTEGDLDQGGPGPFGGQDVFLFQYDSSGDITSGWKKVFGTANDDSGESVAVDSDGNIYMTGSTAGVLDGSNAGEDDVFVRKYLANGTESWTKQSGTDTYDFGRSVVLDSEKNIYITGDTYGDFAGPSGGSIDIMTRKYDPSGNVLWTRQTGDAGDDVPQYSVVDSAGNYYVVGYIYGDLDGDGPLVYHGIYDVFLLKNP